MATPTYDLTTLSTSTVDTLRAQLRAAIVDHAPTSYDLGRGVLHDLVVELTTLLVAATEKDIDEVRLRGSLRAVMDNPTLASTSVVDAILSNYRLTRKVAAAADGQLAIVLNVLQSVTITKGSVFTASGLEFEAKSTFVAKTDAGQVFASTDRLLAALGSNWYFLIDVVAKTAGAGGNLPSGTAMAPKNAPPRFVQAYTYGSLKNGQDTETNQQMLDKLAAGASTRVWGSRTTLQGMLQLQYPTLLHISATGAGDAEQLRDRHGLFPISQGGKTDCWVRTDGLYQTKVAAVTATLLSKVGAVGTWQFGVGRDQAPGFYEVEKVLLATDALTATGFAPSSDVRATDLTGTIYLPDIATALEGAYSRYQTATIQFEDTVTNATALSLGATGSYQAVFRFLPSIDTIQDWLGAVAQRPLASDVVVRAAVPVFAAVSFDLVLPAADPAPDQAAVKAACSAAVHAVGFTDRLSASVLATAVRTLLPNATVDNVSFTGRLRKPSGTNVNLAGTQTMTVSADTASMTTSKTVVFFLPTTAITIAVVRI